MEKTSTLENWKQLFQEWDVRILVLTSLLIQILLSLLSPLRKRCSNSFLRIFLWMLYLCADAVALFAIGQISRNQEETSTEKNHHHQYPRLVNNHSTTNNNNINVTKKADLLAFWAPFLLLHLGGPDTITALALEDNELWRRHALQLATQVSITIYIFSQSFQRSTSLLAPTLLVLIDGCIKYIERICALYFASMENFRLAQRTEPEPGPNYARLMEEYSSAVSGSIPAKIQVNTISQNNKDPNEFSWVVQDDNIATPSTWYQVEETDEMVQNAYCLYDNFKGLLVDAFLSLKVSDESRAFFLQKPAGEAFRMVEIELNFIYDVFYTKVFLLQRKQGYARLFCFLSVTASLVCFLLLLPKSWSTYDHIDIGITLALLAGAIALDVIAVVMFLLSDWFVVISTSNVSGNLILQSLVTRMFRCSRSGPSFSLREGLRKLLETLRRPCSRWATKKFDWKTSARWCQSISKYNMLEQCLKDPPPFFERGLMKWITDLLSNFFIEWLYVNSSPVDKQLGDFIFEELKKTAKQFAKDTDSIKKACSARGNLISQQNYQLVSEYLRPWTVDVDYDESLLIWHLATDLCYWTSTNQQNLRNNYREISKDLSDYMSYLFLRQQTLVSPVVGACDIRFQDTCAEAKKLMHERLDNWWVDAWGKLIKRLSKKPREKILVQSCEKILQVIVDIKPSIAKGDKSKSVLFDSCRLAKQLKRFEEREWEVIAKVWVELLCYAAVRCSTRSHIAELRKGGQLITLVWLLMAHLGLGEKFRQNREFGLTKLIIPK